LPIRDVTDDDLPSILRLNTEFERYLSPLTAGRLRELHAAAAYHRMMAAAGRIEGFLLALREGARYDSPNYGWFARRYPSFLYIDRIVVDAAAQGRGVARTLYADLVAVARGAGLPLLACEFDLEPPNEASARLHRRLGFAEAGRQRLPGGKVVSLQVLRLDAAGRGPG
jgi:predicted GNAT superfamily acetyltransferase